MAAWLHEVDWETAINSRRSVRSYSPDRLDESTLHRLRQFAENLSVPFEHGCHIRFFKADTSRKLYSGALGSPADGAAFMSTTDVRSLAATGFVGELFILYATSLGLATCWFGHYVMSELERIMPHLGVHASSPQPIWGYGKSVVQGERAICITPLGYWQKQGLRLFDRVTETLISYKRKPVPALLEGQVTEGLLTRELLYAIDLARKAPSAANSQHWRFKVSEDLRSVQIAMPVGYKHIKWEHPAVDVGICASHFWLGLMLKGIEPQVSLKEDEGRPVWDFRF